MNMHRQVLYWRLWLRNRLHFSFFLHVFCFPAIMMTLELCGDELMLTLVHIQQKWVEAEQKNNRPQSGLVTSRWNKEMQWWRKGWRWRVSPRQAGREAQDSASKTVSILHEIDAHIALPRLCLLQLQSSQGLCWIIHNANFVCPSDVLISVCLFSLSLSYPSVHAGNTNSVFGLDYYSGSLTVKGQLDRENPLYSAGFTLTVKVSSIRGWELGGTDCHVLEKRFNMLWCGCHGYLREFSMENKHIW